MFPLTQCATKIPLFSFMNRPKGIVVPLEFFHIPDSPTISPRDDLSYKEDKKACKEYSKYFEEHPEVVTLRTFLYTEITREKPQDIISFCQTMFNDEMKVNEMKKVLHL